eukprot:XP_024453250.1 methyl-CpG-binding domain-containing protein 11 [Populus trichocarpa]
MTQLMSPSMVAESYDSNELFQFNIMEHRQYLSLIRGTGETPRRSARISEKAKATPPEKEHPKKRGRKSSGSKKDETGTITEENEGENEVQMQDEENGSEGNAKGFQQALEVKEKENAGEAVKDKAAEEAGSSEVAEDRADKVEDLAEKVPRTEAEKENAPGHKDIPDSFLMKANDGAQKEKTNGTDRCPPASTPNV